MIVELNHTDIACVSAGSVRTNSPVIGWWDNYIDWIIDFRSPSDPNQDIL